MADPLSIAASAAGIATVCFKVTSAIYSFASDARNVDWMVGDLLQEVQGLSRVSEAIGSTWTKNSLLIAAQANSDKDLWSCVKDSLDDTQRTLVKLDDKLEELKPQSFLARGFLRRPIKAMKLNFSMKDIATFKQQLQSHSSGMQSALLMINVCLLLSSNSSSESVNQVLGGLKAQIGRVEAALQGQYHPEDTPEVLEDNARIANNLRGLVRAAESIHSSASTVVGDGRSTVWGGSVMGDPLNEEDYGYIQQWIPPPEIVEEEEEESNHSGSKHESDITGSTSMTSFDNEESGQDSDDSDIERHLTKRYRELAFKSMETKDYDKAESFYSKVIDRGEQEEFPPAELRKMKIMLAYAYGLQGKWQEAEDLLVPIAMAKGTPEVLAYDGLHVIALLRVVNNNDFDLAIKYCKRAAGGHKKFSGKSSYPYHSSMALLAYIYDLKKDYTAAEGYRSFLPTDFQWEIPKDSDEARTLPRELMENKVLQTIRGLRGTPSLSNIASIDVRALTPTPGEQRRHSGVPASYQDNDRQSPRPESSGWGVASPSGSTGASFLEIPSRPERLVTVQEGGQSSYGHHHSLSESHLDHFRQSSLSDTPPPAPTDYAPTGYFSPAVAQAPTQFPTPEPGYQAWHELHGESIPVPKARSVFDLFELLENRIPFSPGHSSRPGEPPRGVFVSPRPELEEYQESKDDPTSMQNFMTRFRTGGDDLISLFAQSRTWRILVAIDLTAENASIAFAAGVTKCLQIPLAAFYNLGGELLGWGDDTFETIQKRQTPGYGKLFWKVDIYKLLTTLALVHDTPGLLHARHPVMSSKSKIAILSDYFTKLREVIKTNLTAILGEPVMETHSIEYVFSVPEDLTESGCDVLEKSAEAAGIYKPERWGPKKPLSIVDSYRAAIIDGVYNGKFDGEAGDVFLDVDIGMRDTRVRALEIRSNKCSLTELTMTVEGRFGYQTLSAAFTTLLDQRIRKLKLPEDSKTAARVRRLCMADLETRIFPSFRGNTGQKWAIEVGIQAEFPEAGIEEGFMTVTSADILQCAENCADGILELAKRQLVEIGKQHKAVKFIFLLGTFNEFHYFSQVLKTLCPSTQQGIVRPFHGGGGERAKGAIIVNLIDSHEEEQAQAPADDPGLGLVRLTYLITTPLYYDPSKHLESVRVTNLDGVDRCYDSAQVFLRTGSIITLGKVITLTVRRPVILGDSLIFQDDIYTFEQRIETGAVISMSSHFGQSPPPVKKIATIVTTLAGQHPENYFQKYPRKRGGWYYTVEYQLFISIRMSNNWIPVPEIYIQSAFVGDDLVTVGELSLPIDSSQNVLFANGAED